MDPDDPVAPLIGSTMALDQAEAGDAIRFARKGLDNALRFVRDQSHPRVEIGVRDTGREQILFVRDNGTGLPADAEEAQANPSRWNARREMRELLDVAVTRRATRHYLH